MKRKSCNYDTPERLNLFIPLTELLSARRVHRVRVAGLIPAGSKPPDVTLMYIYVFRLFLYLGC